MSFTWTVNSLQVMNSPEPQTVAEAKYKAALNVSAVVAARTGATPKLWVAVKTSPRNEVHIDWVLAMRVPYAKEAVSAPANVGIFFRVTCAER